MQRIKVDTKKDVPADYTGIVERDDGRKDWYLNGERHRIDGPAVEWPNGSKKWYLNGKQHRVDGPACELADGSKFWWLNGERHREDGPAYERADGTKEWYLNGEFIFELHSKDQPFLILEETKKKVKILTATETKWIPNLPGLKELENKPCK